MSSDKKIASLLLTSGAVLLRPRQPFTWASGIQSPIYCDNRLLLSFPKARELVIRSFIQKIRHSKLKFDVIAGIATAGIPHAAILADRLKKPLIYVRSAPKGHGKGNQIEGRLEKGQRVLVIEDLVSTGKSSLAAVVALRGAGAKVADCLSIFSYGLTEAKQAFSKSKCKLQSLTTLDVLLEEALSQKRLTLADTILVKKFAKNPTDWR